MTSRMDKIRAALKAKSEKPTTSAYVGDKAKYRFFDAPIGSTVTLRFLPDANEDNSYFWVEKQTIRLPFDNIVGNPEMSGPVVVTVPCNNMFEPKTCPIIKAILPWWKDPAKVDLARKYYKKSKYFYSGFVVASPITEEEDNIPENPIRIFEMSSSLHKIIEASLDIPDMEDAPCEFVGGRDFDIKKTQKGAYADYGTSTWKFKARNLGTNELAAIDQHGLVDLSTYMGARPTSDQLDMIKSMFQESLDGMPFDFASYGATFRPYSVREEFAGDTATAAVSSSFSMREPVDNTEATAAPIAGSKTSHAEIMAKLSKATLLRK